MTERLLKFVIIENFLCGLVVLVYFDMRRSPEENVQEVQGWNPKVLDHLQQRYRLCLWGRRADTTLLLRQEC